LSVERSDLSASPEILKVRFPTSLKGQFRRHAPQYVFGTLTLAAFQLAMNRIDWQSKTAIDTVFGPTPASAWKPAAIMLLLAMGAFVARIASRWYLFNAGRDAEYELRFELLRKLQQLGAAFYSIERCRQARS
jgi:ATP-binding cassette subfamily B multidrug efflux pump